MGAGARREDGGGGGGGGGGRDGEGGGGGGDAAAAAAGVTVVGGQFHRVVVWNGKEAFRSFVSIRTVCTNNINNLLLLSSVPEKRVG